MSNVVIVSLAEFYQEYPEFNNENYLEICPRAFRQSKVYIGIKNNCRLQDEKRKLAIYLLTAHLSFLQYKNISSASSGGSGGLVGSASVGEVSVSFVQIPNLDSFSYWLSLSPYGLELLALLDTLTAVPYYIGGSYERVF